MMAMLALVLLLALTPASASATFLVTLYRNGEVVPGVPELAYGLPAPVPPGYPLPWNGTWEWSDGTLLVSAIDRSPWGFFTSDGLFRSWDTVLSAWSTGIEEFVGRRDFSFSGFRISLVDGGRFDLMSFDVSCGGCYIESNKRGDRMEFASFFGVVDLSADGAWKGLRHLDFQPLRPNGAGFTGFRSIVLQAEVPAPPAWLLALAGALATGAALRRRRGGLGRTTPYR